MKTFCVLLFFCFSFGTYGLEFIAGAIPGLSNFFDTKKPGTTLESVRFTIFDDTNNGAAVEVHLVIVYSDVLNAEICKLSSEEYFRRSEQITKDFPEKVKIFKWTFAAKARVSDWIKVNYPTYETPLAAYIFVRYSGPRSLGGSRRLGTSGSESQDMPHRIRIGASMKKSQIILGKSDVELKSDADKPEKSAEGDWNPVESGADENKSSGENRAQ